MNNINNNILFTFLRTFDLRSKLLALDNKKKNSFSFCIVLAYSYLCTLKMKMREN